MPFPCGSKRPFWLAKHEDSRKEAVYQIVRYPAASSSKKRTSTSSPVVVHADRVLIENRQHQRDHVIGGERGLAIREGSIGDRPTGKDAPNSGDDFQPTRTTGIHYLAECGIQYAREASRARYFQEHSMAGSDEEEEYEHDSIKDEFFRLVHRIEDREYEDLAATQRIRERLLGDLVYTLPSPQSKRTGEYKSVRLEDDLICTSPSSTSRYIGQYKGDHRGSMQPLRDVTAKTPSSCSQDLTINIPSHIPVNLNVSHPSPANSQQRSYNDHSNQQVETLRPLYCGPLPRKAHFLAELGEIEYFREDDKREKEIYDPKEVHRYEQRVREAQNDRRRRHIDRRGGHRYEERASEAREEDDARCGYWGIYDRPAEYMYARRGQHSSM